MKRLIKYIQNHMWYYIIGITSMILSIILDMYNPYLVKKIIDDVIIEGNISIFKLTLFALGFITIGRAILGYIKEYMFDSSSSKIVLNMRKDLFDHIQKQAFSFFDRNNTGELMSRIKEDTENVLHALAFGVMLFLEQIIYFVIASTILFNLNWRLASFCMITMPIIAFLAFKLEKKIRKTFEDISDQRAVLNTTAQEDISGIRLVKAFAREKYEINKFLEQNKKNYELRVEQAEIWAQYHPKIEFLSNIVITFIISIGGYMVVGNDITLGTLVAFSNYIYMLIWPMRMMGWLTNVLAQCNASIQKIEKLYDEKPEIETPEKSIGLKNIKGHVRFNNVSFEHNGVPVLKNVSIDAKPGSTIAIMGMTGSGKSSLVNLIGRYYDCSKGKVCIDGIDVKKANLKTLRNKISVVMQDTFLFSDSIKENIKFGASKISNERLIDAAKHANVDDFVVKMSKGYDTIIGERGIGLSGGQKQRISIARSLARDSKILVLDDATSALDMETEYQIQKSLKKRNDVTKFIIAHRISAVKHADEILILDNGKIVERGTHQELLKLKGKYFETYKQQFKGIQNLKEAR